MRHLPAAQLPSGAARRKQFQIRQQGAALRMGVQPFTNLSCAREVVVAEASCESALMSRKLLLPPSILLPFRRKHGRQLESDTETPKLSPLIAIEPRAVALRASVDLKTSASSHAISAQQSLTVRASPRVSRRSLGYLSIGRRIGRVFNSSAAPRAIVGQANPLTTARGATI